MPAAITPVPIGIVGCSAEGAALCYRTICAEGAQLLGPHAHPEVAMHTPSLQLYVDCLERGDLQGVADLMDRQEQGASLGSVFAQRRADLAALTQVEPVEGLVGHEDRLRCEQGNRQQRAFALTLRQPADAPPQQDNTARAAADIRHAAALFIADPPPPLHNPVARRRFNRSCFLVRVRAFSAA